MRTILTVLAACLLLLSTACGGGTQGSGERTADAAQETDGQAGTGTADQSTEETEETEETGETEEAGEEEVEETEGTGEEEAAERLLTDLTGTYQELFPVLCEEGYRQIWLDACAAVVGEADAEETADLLIGSVTGTLTGEEAVAAYRDGDGAYFCGFLQGVDRFTFDGHEISAVDADGEELFRHTYQFDGVDEATGMYVFESEDGDAGESTYLCLAPDTPKETYHIEFRYGSDLDALGRFDAGPYAYWMAAGIPVDADETMIADCIELFCTENLAG